MISRRCGRRGRVDIVERRVVGHDLWMKKKDVKIIKSDRVEREERRQIRKERSE